MSCGVGRRRGSDLVLLWLWGRPGATALTGPLAWEPPSATGAAQEMAKKTKKKKFSSQPNVLSYLTLKSVQTEVNRSVFFFFFYIPSLFSFIEV